MLKLPSFGMNTRQQMFVPLIHCIIDYTLSLAMPDFSRTLPQFIDVMNLMSVANVFMHISMLKEYILAFTATQEYTPIKFIWLILSLIMQNGGIVLDMLAFCYFW